MALVQSSTIPLPYHDINSSLPPLHNGRRYPHEIPNPTPIPESIRPDVLQLLRKYFDAVSVNGFTMSESSRTSAPGRSEASTGTSITEMTFNFSLTNGTVQREPERRPLEDVQRTRKALMRKLEACPKDFRIRKVKCRLWHHALRELLEVSQNPEDETIVEWAIRLDAEPENPRNETPVSARVASLVAGGPSESLDVIVDRVNNVLDMPPAVPTLYSQDIRETDAALLGRHGIDSPRPPIPSITINGENTPPLIYYSTLRLTWMFFFGLEDMESVPPLYKCQFPGCTRILPILQLASHYDSDHHHFESLRNPLRIFCQKCDHFYDRRIDQCSQCSSTDIVEGVFGRFIFSTDNEDSMVIGGLSDYVSFRNQHQYSMGNVGSSSFMRDSGGFGSYGNYWTSPASTPGGFGCSRSSKIANFFQQKRRNLLFYLAFPYRLLRRLFRGRRYFLIYICGALLMLVAGYGMRDWLFSNIARLMDAVSPASRNHIPRLGVALAFVAFKAYRIIARAQHISGGHCGGWLSRSAGCMLNKGAWTTAPNASRVRARPIADMGNLAE